MNEKLPPLRVGIGIFGYLFHDPLPERAKALVGHLCTERSGTAQDIELARELGFPYMTEQDLRGEYYPAEAIGILADAGLALEYLGYRVASEADIEGINDRLDGSGADVPTS